MEDSSIESAEPADSVTGQEMAEPIDEPMQFEETASDISEAQAEPIDEPIQFEETAPVISEVQPEPIQFEEAAPAVSAVQADPIEEPEEIMAVDDAAATSPAQQEGAVDGEEAFQIETPEVSEDEATIASVQQPEVVDESEAFPIQRYEIDEPREVEAASADDEGEVEAASADDDAEVEAVLEEQAAAARAASEDEAEIERLRQELAATESELERIRAEEELRDYTTSETIASGDSSADDVFSAAEEEMVAAQAREQPMPTRDTLDVAGMPAENRIYFAYDQAALDQQYESVLVAHAEYLKANPSIGVEIQGNCDERGSREYNIALGQRRALTVKRALELLGVEAYRIDTVSFGSEKPVAFGHDEESWRLNRRADIVY
jgi:peptidoglycan-associated lipoprotein